MGEGDEQIAIEDDPNPEKEEVIQPPQVKPTFYQLRFRFFGAQNIVPMDTKTLGLGQNKTDAYVKMEYRTTKLKTKVSVCPEGGECHWNQEFLVPAQVPIIGGRIIFKVYDEDAIKDEIIGSINYDLKDIIPDANGKEGRLNNKFDWKNIYGAPMDTSGKWADKMNHNPEVATLWKGRILVQVVAEKTEKPLLKIENIPEDNIDESRDCWQVRKYAVRCYFYGALCVPENDKKYGVSLRIADKDWTMWEPATSKKRYNRYNAIVTEDLKDEKKNSVLQYYESPYMSIDDIGTIFFYLHYKTKLSGWKRICYWKGSIKKFTDPNA